MRIMRPTGKFRVTPPLTKTHFASICILLMLQVDKWTALHFAASYFHLDVVKYLCWKAHFWKGGTAGELIMAKDEVSGPDDPDS
jgi:hypothetical protein